MVLVMGSFAMPTLSVRKLLLVINVSAHVETVGEGMEPTATVSCNILGITQRGNMETFTNKTFRSYSMIVWYIGDNHLGIKKSLSSW